jgi:peptidoglycan/LPS O-acetylase OafA/YrhL
VEQPAPVSTAGGRPRLGGVDGLRALAAFWVVLFHIRAASGAHVGPIPGLDLFIRSGSTGVSLFLVLSGFCLFIPFAGGRTSKFQVRQFLSRRAKRLLPAYYVTLALVVVLLAAAGGRYGFESHSATDLVGQVVAHVTMVHQFFPQSFYALNGAYWSLGLEWQLYLMMPLVILGVRRYGLAKTVGVVIAVNVVYRLGLAGAIDAGMVGAHGLAATAVLPNLVTGRCGEFALGVVAAELYVNGRAGYWARRLWPALIVVVPLALATVGNPLNHLLFGVVFFTLLCWVVSGDNVVTRIASWRPLVFLGAMSYSIYLVHQPVVGFMSWELLRHGASAQGAFWGTVAMLPVVVGLAWILFVTVEKRTFTAKATAPAGAPATG